MTNTTARSAPIGPTFDFYRPHDPRRTAYTGELVNPVTGELFRPPQRTKQEHKAECDINTIIKTYQRTGMVTHISGQAMAGAYRDLPDSIDYQDALNQVLAAERSFATLPSKVRERFANNPAAFLQFLSDPANTAEAVSLGLATAPPPAPAAAVPPQAATEPAKG